MRATKTVLTGDDGVILNHKDTKNDGGVTDSKFLNVGFYMSQNVVKLQTTQIEALFGANKVNEGCKNIGHIRFVSA